MPDATCRTISEAMGVVQASDTLKILAGSAWAHVASGALHAALSGPNSHDWDLAAADLLVHELLSRTLRDRKAVARYAGLTGSPDESGSKRREKGLSRSGNARVRKIMIQLAWRMVKFQPDSALVQWFKQRTENAKGSRKPMIVALCE